MNSVTVAKKQSNKKTGYSEKLYLFFWLQDMMYNVFTNHMVNKIKISETNELVGLLDDDKNFLDGIDVSKLLVNSNKEINWKCKNGHTFKEKVNVIYRRKNKCFYCTGRSIWPGENDLQSLYPKLAEEFDVEKNNITPNYISSKDTNKYWWKCKNGHPSFQQSVSHRVNRQTVCPYCTERKVVVGVSDLKTLYPTISQEWDIEKNEGILPETISPYTYNSYWWICPKGHSYKKKVIKRTKYHKQIDCPKCVKSYNTSFPEQAIYYYVRKCFPEAINRYKEPFEKGMELDIYVPTFNIGIEYDGAAFHQDEEQHAREFRKYQACKELGIRLVRIKESDKTWSDTSDETFFVAKRMKDEEFQTFLSFLFGSVFCLKAHTFNRSDKVERYLNNYYGFPTDFNVARDRQEILEYLVDIKRSFGKEHPSLAKLWCKDKNGNLTPYMFTSGSNYMAYWKCPKCGETWQSPISSVVSRKVKSCRKCSMRENGKTITKVKTKKFGSLAEKSGILLNQWDWEENKDLSPYEIPLNYSFDVAWKCDKCGYKWMSSPNNRVRVDKISSCPHCAGRVAMPGVDDFETLYPFLAKEWDIEKNEGILPSQIRPFSNKKYYWKCPTCNNIYSAYPGNRIKGSSCPECAKLKIAEKNSRKVGQYDSENSLVRTYKSIHEAAEAMSVVPNSIFQALKTGGRSKKFYWRYIEDNK